MTLPGPAIPLLLAFVIFFAGYMGWEVWRWVSGNRSSLTPGQFRRRLAGGIMLEASMLMWLLEGALMRGRGAGERLLYLLVALLLAVIPMLLAVREAAFVTRQYVRWRGELVRNLGQREEAPAGREE
jgi:hypothetical protein